MNAILIRDQIINLDHVASVKFKENDPEVSHDDRCSITFAANSGTALEVYGEDARQTYERIAASMGISLG